MKTLLKPAALLFYFLTLLTFFFVGVYFAGLTGKAENQGLAAGAIVIGYGVMFAAVALIAAFFFVFYQFGLVKRANRLLFAFLIIIILITTWRFMQRQGEVDRQEAPQPLPPKTEATISPVAEPVQMEKTESGLGMFKPDFYNQRVLYFYGNPNLRKSVDEHLPSDSLVFKRTEMGVSIAYAPPWFVPAHLKLDYDILWLRVQSIGSEFVGVTVNETDGLVYFVNRFAGQLFHWPEFLLQVHSLEILDNQSQPLRVKPLDHAAKVTTDYLLMQPIVVRNEWIQVSLRDDDYNELGTAWIRWRRDEKVILGWSLLS